MNSSDASSDCSTGDILPLADARPAATALRSRLQGVLLRLHHAFENRRDALETRSRTFDRWQRRWTLRWSEIADRLEMIDGGLTRQSQPPSERPRLSLVGVPADGHTMSPMSSGT
ncbi:MAG: hypothetical protein KY476_10330 [Planctomycetes bacterium]|nr:hypothetical protein [Planctomycetota bacterium]